MVIMGSVISKDGAEARSRGPRTADLFFFLRFYGHYGLKDVHCFICL